MNSQNKINIVFPKSIINNNYDSIIIYKLRSTFAGVTSNGKLNKSNIIGYKKLSKANTDTLFCILDSKNKFYVLSTYKEHYEYSFGIIFYKESKLNTIIDISSVELILDLLYFKTVNSSGYSRSEIHTSKDIIKKITNLYLISNIE